MSEHNLVAGGTYTSDWFDILNYSRVTFLSHKMEGKKYRHPKFGEVIVITQPNYIKGSPRNILIRLKNGSETIVPQRSLRKSKKAKLRR